MSRVVSPESIEARAALAKLFDSPPVLVEVRFPKMGTSPDWYFCQEQEEFDEILRRVGPGVEVQLVSVWELDLSKAKGRLCLRK
jgi:hypothetical protein